jgi:hypothetical protein
MRPVVGASRSGNGPLSNILSGILNQMADEMDGETKTECRSTEEMVAGLEEANRRHISDPVTFSADVTALYPSLKAEVVAKEISEAYLESELEIEVDTHQLGLYLVLVVGKAELRRRGLGHVTPGR